MMPFSYPRCHHRPPGGTQSDNDAAGWAGGGGHGGSGGDGVGGGGLTAIFGPSGAGKTSLLHALAGRKPMHRLSGELEHLRGSRDPSRPRHSVFLHLHPHSYSTTQTPFAQARSGSTASSYRRKRCGPFPPSSPRRTLRRACSPSANTCSFMHVFGRVRPPADARV